MNSLRMSAFRVVIFAVFASSAQAQAPSIDQQTMRLQIEPADDSLLVRRVTPELPRELDLSVATRTNFRPIIELSRNRSIQLPLPLDFVVSEDQETLIQFGDPLFRMHPRRLDLYWITNEGTVRRQITNQFDGKAQIKLSPDGYLAVAGSEFLSETPQEQPKPKRVQLIDPRGSVVAESAVSAAVEVTQLVPMLGGQGIVYATAPGANPLVRNQLFVLQQEETREINARRLGIIQKVTVLDKEYALIQGSEAFGLLNLFNAEFNWTRPERIRLVGPQAAAVSQDGSNLLVMTGERFSSAAIYRWTLSILAIESGETKGQRTLDGEASGAPDRVFSKVSDDSALIRFGDKARRVSYR